MLRAKEVGVRKAFGACRSQVIIQFLLEAMVISLISLFLAIGILPLLLLAIIIACFGLLGMATYSTRTRMKEIGIRKVFGAEANHIVLLVSRSYLWLMTIAAAIGGIIAYLVNHLWLHRLAKSVDFGIGTILAGVFIVVEVGLLTISSQTFKAARTHPASILKNE
jgi:putative ABC transport system permease protein